LTLILNRFFTLMMVGVVHAVVVVGVVGMWVPLIKIRIQITDISKLVLI